MSIITIFQDYIGESGINPSRYSITTNDSLSTVTTVGYLDSVKHMGYSFNTNDLISVITTDGPVTLVATVSAGQVTLQNPANAEVNVTLPVVDGNFTVFDGTTGDLRDDGYLPSDDTKTSVVMASAAVNTGHIACFSDTAGTVNDDASTAINAGNIQAGLNQTAGHFTSYPAGNNLGELQYKAANNAGDFTVILTNASHGQSTTYTIPDAGTSTTNLLIADYSVGDQVIATGGLVIASGDMTVLGNYVAGEDGTQGTYTAYPPTALKGSLTIQATNNDGNFDITIENATHGQSTTYLIPDVNSSTGCLLNTALSDADPSANLISFDASVTATALNSGSVTLYSIPGTVSAQRYKIRALYTSMPTVDYATGDRDLSVTDGTNVYSLITAATVAAWTPGSVGNAVWGDSGLPLPASIPMNTSTVAGQNLVIQYSGGTTDYTAGTVVISGILQRIQ